MYPSTPLFTLSKIVYRKRVRIRVAYFYVTLQVIEAFTEGIDFQYFDKQRGGDTGE